MIITNNTMKKGNRSNRQLASHQSFIHEIINYIFLINYYDGCFSVGIVLFEKKINPLTAK